MLKIHIGSLTETAKAFDYCVEVRNLPLLDAICSDGSICFFHPVNVHIRAAMAGESVAIDGGIKTCVHLTCSRCLQPFKYTLTMMFSATALPSAAISQPLLTTEMVELSQDEMDVIFYSGDHIDLCEETSQQIIMALPFKPLCKDNCKGLCSHCGCDLNQQVCRCHQQNENSPFALLKQLSFPDAKKRTGNKKKD